MRTNVSESRRRQTRSLPAFLMLALALSVPSLLAGAEPDSDPDAAAMTRLEWMPRNQRGMLNVSADLPCHPVKNAIKAAFRDSNMQYSHGDIVPLPLSP